MYTYACAMIDVNLRFKGQGNYSTILRVLLMCVNQPLEFAMFLSMRVCPDFERQN